jgi:hypothetical protein
MANFVFWLTLTIINLGFAVYTLSTSGSFFWVINLLAALVCACEMIKAVKTF